MALLLKISQKIARKTARRPDRGTAVTQTANASSTAPYFKWRGELIQPNGKISE
jgi:hypothetical protein